MAVAIAPSLLSRLEAEKATCAIQRINILPDITIRYNKMYFAQKTKYTMTIFFFFAY